MTERTEDQGLEGLERAMRDGLQRRAESAETAAPVADRARAAVRRRRGGRVAAGVAGLAVAAVAVTGVVLQQTGPATTQPLPLATDNPSATASATGGAGGDWRTESWHGVQVDVPDEWGWGSAPRSIDENEDAVYFCGGPGAMVRADGKRLANPEASLPYVGRPIMLSDVCSSGHDGAPRAPYVWFDAEGVDPGTEELGDGYVRETVEVAGSTVTVASPDAAVRARVLGSARPNAGRECGVLVGDPLPGGTIGVEKVVAVDSATVCAYQREAGGRFQLVYADDLEPERAQAFIDGARAARDVEGSCAGAVEDEYVAISTEGRSPTGATAAETDLVVLGGCPRIEMMDGGIHELTRADVEPWATGGLPVVLRGPTAMGAALSGYFIGMLG